MSDDWILTYTGLTVHPLNPAVDEIDIIDIAHALSHICRFTGHTRAFYSVAQHSVLVSKHVQSEHALWGLLHDASEAYLADIARPVKKQPALEGYRQAESNLMRAITERFGLPHEMPEDVADADNRILLNERRALMPHNCGPIWPLAYVFSPLDEVIEPWSPAEANLRFLERFIELTRQQHR